jgi:hypothetical protein
MTCSRWHFDHIKWYHSKHCAAQWEEPAGPPVQPWWEQVITCNNTKKTHCKPLRFASGSTPLLLLKSLHCFATHYRATLPWWLWPSLSSSCSPVRFDARLSHGTTSRCYWWLNLDNLFILLIAWRFMWKWAFTALSSLWCCTPLRVVWRSTTWSSICYGLEQIGWWNYFSLRSLHIGQHTLHTQWILLLLTDSKLGGVGQSVSNAFQGVSQQVILRALL